jgi:hypothetical protein
MTIVAFHPARTAAPRAFALPVVREIVPGHLAGAAYLT